MTEFRRLNRRFFTLNSKMIYTLLMALVLATLVSYLTDSIAVSVVENHLLSDEAVAKRQSELLEAFAGYVDKNDIASDDTEKLDEWCRKNSNAFLTIYREDDTVLRVPPPARESGDSTDMPSASVSDSVPSATDAPSTQHPEDASQEGIPDAVNGEDTAGLFGGAQLPSETEPAQSAVPDSSEKDTQGKNPEGQKPGAAKPQRETVYNNNSYDYIVYRVRFSDGVCSVTLTDLSESYYYELAGFFSMFAFFLTFFIIMLIYNRYLIRRVGRVSEQVSVARDGNPDARVVLPGNDELSLLADNVDEMRKAILERYLGEQRAWKANQELITSISHDVRNPLTTLIGYSDLLVNKQYRNEEELERYLASCRDKAYQLKDLTDEMFGYFLVFGEPEVKVNCTTENAQILLGQLLGEPMADLRERGYRITGNLPDADREIFVDVICLKRVFDNLFANIQKYADPAEPVIVDTACTEDAISIRFSNTVKTNGNPVESTKIGIKTCERLCEALSIGFSCHTDGNRFLTELMIPAATKPQGESN